MANTLERMVDRIYQEGIHRAEERAHRITSAAENDAREIRQKAQREAEEIVQRAKTEAERIRKATESDLQLLAVRVFSRLKSEISRILVAKTVSEPLTAAVADTNFISAVILRLLDAVQGKDMTVAVPESLREEVTAQLKDKLSAGLAGVQIAVSDHSNGFTIVRKDSGYELDFSEAALREFLDPYLKPALAALFREQNGAD